MQISYLTLGSLNAMVSSDARLYTTGGITTFPNIVINKTKIRGIFFIK